MTFFLGMYCLTTFFRGFFYAFLLGISFDELFLKKGEGVFGLKNDVFGEKKYNFSF